jgi:hypothetical protein
MIAIKSVHRLDWTNRHIWRSVHNNSTPLGGILLWFTFAGALTYFNDRYLTLALDRLQAYNALISDQ